MWKVPVLLLVLGSAWLWVLAEGASTVRPEDDTTPVVEGGMVTPSIKVKTVTPDANEKHESTGLPTLVPRGTKSPGDHEEDMPTRGNSVHYPTESRSTRSPNVVTNHTMGKAGENTETTVEKDGLSTVTLVGIVVGVLVAIGVIGGVIVVIMRKMSGRFSP